MIRHKVLRFVPRGRVQDLPGVCRFSGLVSPDRDSGSPHALPTQAVGEHKSLEGKVAWVVGGVGVIGRGLCYGLLKAGATVLVNSGHQNRLQRLHEDLNHPAKLISMVGTMRPSGADKLVHEAMEMTGRHIDHVIAHSGVRWWARSDQVQDTSISDCGDSKQDALSLDPEDFNHRAPMLPALHYAAAQRLLPRLLDLPNASYIFVTGCASEQQSIMSQVNAHAVWGLAAALCEQYRDSRCRVIEVRANLKMGRPPHERALDPRARPLSADIGEICAGLASSQNPDCRGLCEVNTMEDVEKLKAKYPCPDVVSGLPVLWYWQRAAKQA